MPSLLNDTSCAVVFVFFCENVSDEFKYFKMSLWICIFVSVLICVSYCIQESIERQLGWASVDFYRLDLPPTQPAHTNVPISQFSNVQESNQLDLAQTNFSSRKRLMILGIAVSVVI